MARAIVAGCLLLLATAVSLAADRSRILVLSGAAGAEEYGAQFSSWVTHWIQAAARAEADCTAIGLDLTNKATDRDLLRAALTNEVHETASELWLVFLGHGTFDGKDAKFNLRGPDLTAAELADWLKPFLRPIAVINSASSSGPFLRALSGPNRVIVTSTRSGFEQNYARFGGYLAAAVGNLASDLDKDGQVSLLEAFLFASRETAEFYKVEGRLATEHALLDDNGDGLGTPADWFRGVRAVKKPVEKANLDGLRANQFHLIRSEQDRNLTPEQRQRRDELEVAVEALRERKAQMPEDDYYAELEKLMVRLSEFYR